jgi:hypothetical protein
MHDLSQSRSNNVQTKRPCCCSTTTKGVIAHRKHIATMLRSVRPRLPADIYNIDNHVKCIIPRSKHYGHTARVMGMGKTRLSVEFHHGHIGKYLDWRDVELFVPPRTPRAIVPPWNPQTPRSTTTAESDIGQLTTLLEHMAFTAASVISSEHGNSQRMESLITLFDQQVRDHVNALSSNQQSPQNNPSVRHSNVNQVPPDGF